MFELPKARKIPDLSKGMRSKLMLLLAIARGAELLILDEPTDGLDPAATEAVLRELVSITGSSGITIFFSSHQLSEVELIADHVGIVDRGRMPCSQFRDCNYALGRSAFGASNRRSRFPHFPGFKDGVLSKRGGCQNQLQGGFSGQGDGARFSSRRARFAGGKGSKRTGCQEERSSKVD